MNGTEILTLIIMLLKDLVNSADTIARYRTGNSFSRNRKLSFKTVVLFLLFQGMKALTCSIDDFLDSFSDELQLTGHFTKQAMSKARKHISPDIFREMLQITVRTFFDCFDPGSFWDDRYHVFAIDGTDLQVPQRPQCLKAFSFFTDRKRDKFAMGKGSLLYSVSYGSILDFQVHKFRYSERKLAVKHIKAIQNLPFSKTPLVIMDRGYYSEDLCHYFHSLGIKYVFRVKKNLREIQKMRAMNCLDTIITLNKQHSPFAVRVLRLNLGKDAGEEYLITNIYEKSIGLKRFKELYFLRWPVEIKYNELKSKHCIENFTGYTEQSVLQDCFITCIYSNLSAIARIDADQYIIQENIKRAQKRASSDALPDKFYKSKITRSVEQMRKRLPQMLCEKTDIENGCKQILSFLCLRENWSQVIPNRSFKRVIHQPTRKYHYNQKCCF